MKNRYWFISILVLLITCSYLFYYFYEMERERKIEEIFSHQKIHAKQAARSFYELFDKWNSVLFYLSNDREIIQMNERGKTELNDLLKVLKNEVKGITRADSTGKIIYTTPYYPNSIGADISKQKHMIKILYDHKPVVSDVFNAVQGFQAIVIHYPVFNNGKFDGTIALLLNFGQIAKKILDDIKIGNSGYAWMLSNDGVELYCPVPGHLGKSIYETAHGYPELLNLAKKMLSGSEGTATYTYNISANNKRDDKKIAYYLPIKIDGTFWSLAVTYSEYEITASLKDFGIKLIIILASIFLGGVFFTYFGVKALVIVKESAARKITEKNLKESEERYRLISTAASDYMFSTKINDDGKFEHVWVAGAFETITGYTFDEYVAIGGWKATLHPDDIEKDNSVMQTLGNNKAITSEVRTITKQGKIVWVSVFASPVWDEKNNKLAGITGAVQDITERKLAEEALRNSENKFEKAFRSSPDSITISSLVTGKIIECNDGFERLFGYSSEEAIGKDVLELNLYDNPSDRDFLRQKLKLDGRVNNFETIGRRKSGERRTCLLSFEIMDFMGEACIISTVRDITEQKQAAEALKESEFFLSKSQLVAHIGSYYFNAVTGLMKRSHALNNLFGIDESYRKDIDGWISLIHPDNKEEMQKYFIQNVLTEHNRFEKEYKIIRYNDHQVRWVYGYGELEFDKNGNITAMIGIVQDITERKLAEEALRSSENKFEKIFHASPDSITISILQTGKILEVNEGFEQLSGYSRNEAIGKTAFELNLYANPSDREILAKKLISEFKISNFEMVFRRRAGELLTCILSMELIDFMNDKCIVSIVRDITERKLAEEALKESEFFLSKSQAVARIGSYYFDAITGKWRSSPALDELFGIDENYNKDINGWRAIIHPEERDELIGYLSQHVLAKHNRFEKEYRIIRQDTMQERWVFGHGELELDEQGNTLNMIGTIQDITERKLAEQALKKSEERFRMIFERGQFGLVISNSEYRFIDANPAFCKMIGYTEEELKSLTYADITPPVRIQLDRENVEALGRGEIKQYRAEKQYVRKDGKTFWGSLVTTAVRNAQGNVEYYIAMVQDISELKHAEEELIKFYVATEQSPASIAITDTDGRIEYINTTFTKISGYSLDEMKGKYLKILKPSKSQEANSSHIWKTIKSGSEWRGEFYNKKKDGTLYWESILISPIKDNNGKTTHYLAIQEDITEKRQTLGELILAKEKAEEANRVKNVFLANMSHELRTPLIGILGYSEMLVNQLSEEETNEMAKGIKRSGNRLLTTLNLILDLTRIESNQFELNLETINLVDEIEISFALFNGAAQEKNLDYTLKINSAELFVEIDERLFRVIIENLLNNAIKFTNKGSVSVIAGIEKNRTVYVTVKDTGIGIAKEHHDMIYEEFKQVSSGISRDYQGTGLGLSITKKYVEILGGTIKVESELNVGSTFTVRFPLSQNLEQWIKNNRQTS